MAADAVVARSHSDRVAEKAEAAQQGLLLRAVAEEGLLLGAVAVPSVSSVAAE